MIIQIIPSIKGGGAEFIARKLNQIFLKKKLESYAIFFSGKKKEKKKNEIILNLSLKNPLIIFSLRRTIRELLINKKKIIVHAHLTWAFFYTVLATLGLKNIRLVYTVHYTDNRRRKYFIFKFIDYLFYLKYSFIICVSFAAKKKFVRWFQTNKKNILVIQNGSRIYPLKFRRSLKNRLPKLISIGSLIDSKNFLTTISAVSKLRDKVGIYKIVGDGHQKELLQKRINSLKLESKVKLIGWSDDIKYHLNASDIMLIPSLSEAFGLVATEGMSTGLPIVASNIDGLKEVIGNNNSIVTYVNEAKSIREWERKIMLSIKKTTKSGFYKISKLSAKQAKKFSIKKMANNYLSIYKKIY